MEPTKQIQKALDQFESKAEKMLADLFEQKLAKLFADKNKPEQNRTHRLHYGRLLYKN